MRLIELFNILERRKFRKPVIMYHGTSDSNLRGILKQGILPSSSEKVWATGRKEISPSDFSLASLEGSYWTSNLMTARASAITATAKFNGESLMVMAQIAESSTFADEDSINSNILRALPDTFNSLRREGQGLIPEAAIKSAALIYYGGWNEAGFNTDSLRNTYAELLHKSLAGDAEREPVDKDLMRRMMEAHMMRQLAYAKEYEGSGFYKDQYVKEMDRLADEGKVPPIPPLAEVEQTVKELQDALTRKYRKTAFANDESYRHTLRITEPVTFRGANRILCIMGELANWKEIGYEAQYKAPLVLYYGQPPADFFEQYKQRVGEWKGALNQQGDMVIPPVEPVQESSIEDRSTWRRMVSQFPMQLQREIAVERPNPDQDDMQWMAGLKLLSDRPVTMKTADLLKKQENIDNISRTPQKVIDIINKNWNINVPIGNQYDRNPDRYIKYAKMTASTADPSVMVNGEIIWGVGRFIAALLRGDKTINVWSLSHTANITEDIPVAPRRFMQFTKKRIEELQAMSDALTKGGDILETIDDSMLRDLLSDLNSAFYDIEDADPHDYVTTVEPYTKQLLNVENMLWNLERTMETSKETDPDQRFLASSLDHFIKYAGEVEKPIDSMKKLMQQRDYLRQSLEERGWFDKDYPEESETGKKFMEMVDGVAEALPGFERAIASASKYKVILDKRAAFFRGEAQHVPETEDVETLWHASIYADEIDREGFSPEGRGERRGVGTYGDFGGISFTHDLQIAREISRALKELSMVVNGQLTRRHILGWMQSEGITAEQIEKMRQSSRDVLRDDSVEAVIELYNIWIWLTGLRDNPLFTNMQDLIPQLKGRDPNDIGIIQSDVDMRDENIRHQAGEAEWIVPASAVQSVKRIL